MTPIAQRRLDAALAAHWRELMDADNERPGVAEALRRTARGAVEDWLESRRAEQSQESQT